MMRVIFPLNRKLDVDRRLFAAWVWLRAGAAFLLLASALAAAPAGREPTPAETDAAVKPASKPSEVSAMEERYALAREVARQEEIEFDGKYRAALEQVMAKAKAEGDLDGVLAAEAALAALEKDGPGAFSAVPAVANLQRIRSANIPAVRAKTTAGLMKLEAARLKELEALVPQLVKMGDIKQAQRAKELAGEAQKTLDGLMANETRPAVGRPVVAPERTPAVAQWIWSTAEIKKDSVVFFRRAVEVPAGLREARLRVTCDDSFELFVDGKPLTSGTLWNEPKSLDLAEQLSSGGRHVFAVRAANGIDNAGMAFLLEMTMASGERLAVVSDATWKATEKESRGWDNPSFSDAGWKNAAVLAPMGAAPWGNVFAPKK